jgi:pimeloyl-ACP methyl ester carboxylesterase
LTWVWVVVSVLVALPLFGILYQHIGAWLDRRKYPPAGRMLHLAGCDLHVWEQGSGSPAVIFESGIAASSLSWAHVQPELAKELRTCSYDRAGLGWSSLPRTAYTLELFVAHLETLLANAKIEAPYILVGHSFGSLLIRAFAAVHPTSVAGLVLVDPVSIESWAAATPRDLQRLRAGAYFSRRGALLARFGIVRFALAAASLRHKGLTKTIAKVSAGKATATLTRLVGEVQKLPPAVLPVARAEWSLPKCFEAMARHLEILPQCAAAIKQMELPPGVPVAILSASTATERELHERESWIQDRLGSNHRVVPGTGHWLHLERPDVVAAAVREVAANHTG